MAKRAIKVIDQVVIEQMKGKVDVKNNVWLIPTLRIEIETNNIHNIKVKR
jgi:hypothetical protein